ncbi:hypothetical protein [Geochorda subterranea]|uniref:Sporulation membrane protein YtrI C-terminal domain-containing protein n=1 Tax=Geochorda subterranea TaxID=3109564 RepID=A0ABZ1BSG4_9FIRM|nr:hypothetical protein [Limnochorda sp. LNt]WRP15436.1 hypothetical protein VLY81_04540 [Limnochorda sp. LNt]
MRPGGWAAFYVVSRGRLAAWLAVLVLGALVGAAGATVQMGRHVDAVMRQRDRLEQQVQELQGRLQRLEASLAEQRRRPVRATAVRISGLDPSEELQLRREVQALLQEVVGREVDQVDPALVAGMLDGRLMALGGRTVALSVRSIWLTDTLTVSLEVRAAPES